VLEKKPRLPQLPNYVEIDHATIRDAAAAWDAAKAALESARKDLTELEQTREAAEWADAEAAEAARAEGKPEPKRSHVAAHDKKLDVARHEWKVAQLAEERTFDALQAALDEHAGEWSQTVEHDVQTLECHEGGPPR
jgi:chromosome segregation ATPase